MALQAGMAVEEHQGKRYIMMYKPSVLVHPLTGLSIGDPATDDPSWEPWFRRLALPVMLALAAVIHLTALGPMLLRNFFGMWLHELGHASAAWVCGRFAVPVPWMTYASDDRSVGVTVAMLLLTGGLGVWSFRQRRWWAVGVSTALVVLCLFCTATLSTRAVQVFGIFSGDAGAMVFGVGLMSTFYARRESRLVQGALRWGFVWWGAAAFVDSWATWVAARRDMAEIPFGVEEVGGQALPGEYQVQEAQRDVDQEDRGFRDTDMRWMASIVWAFALCASAMAKPASSRLPARPG